VSGNKVFAAGQLAQYLCRCANPYRVLARWELDRSRIAVRFPLGNRQFSCSLRQRSLPSQANSFRTIPPGYWLNGTWNGLPVPSGSDLRVGAFPWSYPARTSMPLATASAMETFCPAIGSTGTWTGVAATRRFNWRYCRIDRRVGKRCLCSGIHFLSNPRHTQEAQVYWLNGSWVGLALPTGQTAGAVTFACCIRV